MNDCMLSVRPGLNNEKRLIWKTNKAVKRRSKSANQKRTHYKRRVNLVALFIILLINLSKTFRLSSFVSSNISEYNFMERRLMGENNQSNNINFDEYYDAYVINNKNVARLAEVLNNDNNEITNVNRSDVLEEFNAFEENKDDDIHNEDDQIIFAQGISLRKLNINWERIMKESIEESLSRSKEIWFYNIENNLEYGRNLEQLSIINYIKDLKNHSFKNVILKSANFNHRSESTPYFQAKNIYLFQYILSKLNGVNIELWNFEFNDSPEFSNFINKTLSFKNLIFKNWKFQTRNNLLFNINYFYPKQWIKLKNMKIMQKKRVIKTIIQEEINLLRSRLNLIKFDQVKKNLDFEQIHIRSKSIDNKSKTIIDSSRYYFVLIYIEIVQTAPLIPTEVIKLVFKIWVQNFGTICGVFDYINFIKHKLHLKHFNLWFIHSLICIQLRFIISFQTKAKFQFFYP